MATPKKQSANFTASTTAKKLLEAPTYLQNLQTRLEAGALAPAVEAMLWHYAYGKPIETLQVNHYHEKLEAMSDEELDSLENELRGMPVSEQVTH